MPYTPVELRHVRIGRSLLGYNRRETEQIIDGVADSFEEVWRERGELSDKLEELEKRLAEYRQREELLSATLVAAERAAAEAKEAARREAELILAEAHHAARSVTRGAQGERERLFAEARRVEALLRSALGMVEEGVQGAAKAEGAAPAEPSAAGEPEPPADSWPAREDTREFPALTVTTAAEPETDDSDEIEEVDLPPMPPAAENGAREGAAPGRDFDWG